MKKLISTLILSLLLSFGFSQTAIQWFNKGKLKGQLGDLKSAILLFDKAITLNPKYDEAYLNRGFAKFMLNDYENAIEDFTESIELNPTLPILSDVI